MILRLLMTDSNSYVSHAILQERIRQSINDTTEQLDVRKNEAPEKFYALCDENRREHEKIIQDSYEKLVKDGVPEKYIFVIQANRDDPLKRGDLFSYSNKERLEETLSSVRHGAQICCSPDVFIFLCTDIRDRVFMSRYLNPSYFKEQWFKEMFAHYCGKDQ